MQIYNDKRFAIQVFMQIKNKPSKYKCCCINCLRHLYKKLYNNSPRKKGTDVALITLVSGKDISLPTAFNYWIGLLYLAILASFVAWLFYLYLVKNVGAAESSYMVAMFPAIGGFASVMMGETVLSINLVVGIILAMLGAYIALAKKRESITK